MIVKAAELVVQVRCLHCRHKSILDNRELAGFGIKSGAPIASFVQRLRCSNCGSESVIANRIVANERAARRLRA
jgi:DNA-directed RNA polymerase subunit RPC12/RpoP